MAGGQIDGFFKKAKPGQPLCALANVDNLNRVANVLNDISGEGCTIEKPKDGEPWIIHVSDTESDNEPILQKKEMQCEVTAANQAIYANNYVRPQNATIYVNGIAVQPASEMKRYWEPTAGLKYLYIFQHFSDASIDADGQWSRPPTYLWATSTEDAYSNDALVAKIPYCRVEIPEVGQPPKIKNLLEGPLNLYCFRGDSENRAFAESPANPNRQKPKSKTTEHGSNGELPLKVRNISASPDGYYNAYPNGRYTIESSSGSAEVVWNEPHEPEQSKNDAKLLLLRYINKSLGTPHGLPYWVTINQFLHNSETWVEDYAAEEIDNRATWLWSVISPWAWDVYAENPGPFEPKLTNDEESETQILAAVKDRQGNWVTVADVVVMQSDLDVALEDWQDLSADADAVVSQIENFDDDASSASAMADEAESSASAFTDFTAQAALAESEAQSAALEAGQLLTDFISLDARITALEGQIQ